MAESATARYLIPRPSPFLLPKAARHRSRQFLGFAVKELTGKVPTLVPEPRERFPLIASDAARPTVYNPLLRWERMGCGWLAVILKWEGVVVETDPEPEKQAWLALSVEESKPPPPAFILQRIKGMKAEQAISEVLCWSRDPSHLLRLSSRKEAIQEETLHLAHRPLRPGSQEFMGTLSAHKIPMAVASTRPRRALEAAIDAADARGYFAAIIASEDVSRGKPDPEMFVYAAHLLGFIPWRCIVFGDSNSSVEAAHGARMKCVAIAGRHRAYELGAADLVVRRLGELSIVDLKNLADVDPAESIPSSLEMVTSSDCNDYA